MIRAFQTALYAAILISPAAETAIPSEKGEVFLYRITEYRPGEETGRLVNLGPWVSLEDCLRAAEKAIANSPIGTEAECALTSFYEDEGRGL